MPSYSTQQHLDKAYMAVYLNWLKSCLWNNRKLLGLWSASHKPAANTFQGVMEVCDNESC